MAASAASASAAAAAAVLCRTCAERSLPDADFMDDLGGDFGGEACFREERSAGACASLRTSSCRFITSS